MKDVKRRPRDAGEDEAMPFPAKQGRQAKTPGAGQGGKGNRRSPETVAASKRSVHEAAARRPDRTTSPASQQATRDPAGRDGAPQDATGKAGAVPVLQKRALLDKVCAETGQPRAQVRALTDAVLAELGRALARGEDLVLPPLGKVRVSRQRTGKGIVMRLRHPGTGDPAGTAVADLFGADDD